MSKQIDGVNGRQCLLVAGELRVNVECVRPFIVLSMKLHANAKLQSDESDEVFNTKNLNKLCLVKASSAFSQLLIIFTKLCYNFFLSF